MSEGCSHSWAKDGPELACVKCSARSTIGLTEQQQEDLVADEVPSWLTRHFRLKPCDCHQATGELPPDFDHLLAQIMENEKKKG